MRFGFSEEQEELRRVVRRFLDETSPLAEARRLMDTPEGYERRLFEATKLYEGHESAEVFPYWEVAVTGETATELATLQTNVENFVTQAGAEFVTGVRDIESDDDWNEFQQHLTDLGAERYVEIYQEAWDAAR